MSGRIGVNTNRPSPTAAASTITVRVATRPSRLLLLVVVVMVMLLVSCRPAGDGTQGADGSELPISLDLCFAGMDIELRHLRAFAAVAELRSFTAASRRLVITQPALTRTIQQLERILGVD